MTSSAIAVLVELPLAVPFETFTAVFDMQIQPVVMRQEGIISFKKGRKLEDTPVDRSAILLAIWQNVHVNDVFLASKAAQYINDRTRTLVRGLTTMTRFQMNVGPQSMDYIPYSSIRKFRMYDPASPDSPGTRGDASQTWLSNVKGLNVVSTWAESCSYNSGCHACSHVACKSDRLLVVSLNGLSPESVRKRLVIKTDGAELLASFTIEWITSTGSADWGTPVSQDKMPLQRSRDLGRPKSRSYWNTILAENINDV